MKSGPELLAVGRSSGVAIKRGSTLTRIQLLVVQIQCPCVKHRKQYKVQHCKITTLLIHNCALSADTTPIVVIDCCIQNANCPVTTLLYEGNRTIPCTSKDLISAMMARGKKR